ncbi:MAG TPA: LacI family DNA-binding transcriptional regulator [Salinimicrobium sp.]|nr:LacI family DNA-binding transcriptional regulator [Salinimicrobium sp.]
MTLKELAKLLNVSVSTVSKSLNNSPEISEKTIARVKELAELHHYMPNPTAVNLKNSKSGTIAVVVPNITNPFFAKVLSGIEKEAQKKGLQVITYISDESYKREKQIVEMISYGYVDGVLISPSEETQKMKEYSHFRELLEYGMPMVLYDRINVDVEVDKIGVDDRRSIYEATNLFCAKGLRNIGLISDVHHLDVGKERIKGYQDALHEKGLAPNIITSENREELESKITEILKSDVEGIICTDIVSTMLTSRLAHVQKSVIPGKLKIIGYINEDIAPFFSPSLSYIDQHPRKIGEIAIDFLVNRINNKDENEPFQHKILNTQLVHLESSHFD